MDDIIIGQLIHLICLNDQCSIVLSGFTYHNMCYV